MELAGPAVAGKLIDVLCVGDMVRKSEVGNLKEAVGASVVGAVAVLSELVMGFCCSTSTSVMDMLSCAALPWYDQLKTCIVQVRISGEGPHWKR